MAEPTREQLMTALRRADAAGDEAAAVAIARRIKGMNAPPVKPVSAEEKRAIEIKNKRDKDVGKAGFKDILTQGFTFGLSDEAAGVGNAISNAIVATFSDKVDFDPVGSYNAGARA